MTAKASGETYLPVFAHEDGSQRLSPERNAAPESSTRDPLYAAMLGTSIGSSPIPAGAKSPERNTLNEPIADTLVPPHTAAALCRKETPSGS